MTTIVASSGTDTWVRDDAVNKNQNGGNLVRLQFTHRRGLVHVPVSDIRGRTVLSAVLTGRVDTGFVAQTITVKPLSASWSAGRATWTNQPDVLNGGVGTSLPATPAGSAVNLNVLPIMQAVANGTPWHGVQLSTGGTALDAANFIAFESAQPAWTLTVELSDAPEQPTDLRPNVGAVGSPRPILAWSYVDLGGGSTEQGAFRVQVDPAANGTTPAFDTGFLTSGDPQYDLSSGTFTALANGATTQWRVMTRDGDGNNSIWSDWAPFTYRPYPTLIMDSPTGGTIGDNTPDVIAHMTGETMTQWRVRVLNPEGHIRWSSGRQDGPLSVTIPQRDDDGHRIIHVDDLTYTIEVRAWGTFARAIAVGLPSYVQQLVNVVFDDDIGVVVPTNFAVAPVIAGDPRTVFTWDRNTAPLAVTIMDGNKVYARLTSDDWKLNAGHYSWTDNALSDPYVNHPFVLRAIDTVGGVRKRSKPTATVNYIPKVIGVWLVAVINFAGDTAAVKLDTKTSIDTWGVVDRVAIYKPLNRATNVTITYGYEGASGTFTGTLSADFNQTTAVDTLKKIRDHRYASPQLVWGISIPVDLTNLKVLPAGDYTAAQALYNVSFDFIQHGSN